MAVGLKNVGATFFTVSIRVRVRLVAFPAPDHCQPLITFGLRDSRVKLLIFRRVLRLHKECLQ